MFALAASLAFKLQAVFIIPVFFLFLICGKIKPKHLLLFPAAYILYMLPAVIAGMPFGTAVTMYVSDASTVGDALNYNAPSLTAMLTDCSVNALIIAAFAFVALVYVYAIGKRESIDNYALLCAAVLLAIGQRLQAGRRDPGQCNRQCRKVRFHSLAPRHFSSFSSAGTTSS